MSRFVLEAAKEMWRLPAGGRKFIATTVYHGDVLRQDKMSLLVNANKRDFSVYVFPKPEDVSSFFKGVSKLRADGPWSGYPGTVGSVVARIHPDKPNELNVESVQGHFKTGETPLLSRSLATKYLGWRVHALRELFRHAKEKDMHVVFADLRNAKVKEEIEQVVREYNGDFKVERISEGRVFRMEVKNVNAS